MSEVVLTQYAIYANPRDAPGKFVVREWRIMRGVIDPVIGKGWVADTLEAARLLVPAGLFPLPRSPLDDPCIVETWT